jgi:hypothetical protein
LKRIAKLGQNSSTGPLAPQRNPPAVEIIPQPKTSIRSPEIERCLAEFVVEPVRYRESERIRSHFGTLEIDGVKVEIMGAVQKRVDNRRWEEPVEVDRYKQRVEIGDMHVPVLPLEYEYQAYLRLGRNDKVEILRAWLQISRKGPNV